MSLENRVKTLISIGTSIGANCQPCLQYHVGKAKEMGISEEEILEAINVGRTVRGRELPIKWINTVQVYAVKILQQMGQRGKAAAVVVKVDWLRGHYDRRRNVWKQVHAQGIRSSIFRAPADQAWGSWRMMFAGN